MSQPDCELRTFAGALVLKDAVKDQFFGVCQSVSVGVTGMGAGARVAKIHKFPGCGFDRVQQTITVSVWIERVCACVRGTDKDASIGLYAIR